MYPIQPFEAKNPDIKEEEVLVADEVVSKPDAVLNNLEIRSHFPETWIWADEHIGYCGYVVSRTSL